MFLGTRENTRIPSKIGCYVLLGILLLAAWLIGRADGKSLGAMEAGKIFGKECAADDLWRACMMCLVAAENTRIPISSF